MVNFPGSSAQQLLLCLEDNSSPPEDKTDAYLRLADDLAKEDQQFVEDVCNFSARLFSVLTRDMLSQRNDLSQAALQAVGYCIYQDKIVSSLREAEMSVVIQGLCNAVVNSKDNNFCTRALWGIAKQHLSTNIILEKLPVILHSVNYALVTFESTTVENEALEVIYRLISDLPSDIITSTAVQWSKLVYPLLISSAHKIREKALGILELGLKLILLAQQDVVGQLITDLKGGLLSELTKLFAEKKEVFVLRTWTVLVTILGETLHKSGSLINDMLKIPEQGFKSPLPNVQNMSYSAWGCLIDNFATSPAFIGSQRKIKLLMMPLILHPGKVIHKDIELGRLQAWWHLVCVIKPEIYTTTMFSEVCLPLLQYFFDVSVDLCTTPLGCSKDGLRELAMPVTPVARGQTTPSSNVRNTPKRKSVVFNKGKFPEAFVKQIMLLGCEILMEILATSTDEIQRNKRLTEHLKHPILTSTLFQEYLPFFLAVVKSALRSCGSYLEDELAISIWSNVVNWSVATLLSNGDPTSTDDVIMPLFLTANDILTCSCLSPSSILKYLDLLSKIPVRYLLHSVAVLSSICSQGKPVFLLAKILFGQLSAFNESYVDERFHIVFENLIDISFESPSRKLTTVHNVWLAVESLASTVAKVEDLWRFWSKVKDSVSECVTKTSDVNQGDSLDPDFSLMISLLSFPFKQLFTGGLPVATTKELDQELAEFFRLFCRCASLVPNAEANASVEELSKSLLVVVSREKCKTVKFIDSICGLIYVMMDCVDFSAQNTSSPRGNLTPSGKTKHAERLLGNLSSIVALSAKVLSISHSLDKDSFGSIMVAPAVTVLVGSLSKLFANLKNSQHIKFTIGALSSSITAFILNSHGSSETRSSDKKFYNVKYLSKIEKLWTDILMCLQSRYTAAYDSQLLETMSTLLECTFCHQRRQFKNQTIMFWNATFGQASYLDYPASLRECLQTVLVKTPLTLPGWDQSTTKVATFDLPSSSQDFEETPSKDSIVTHNVILANSPKRTHSGSSPGKLKGSFLHKAFGSDKTNRLSPYKVRYQLSENNLETGNKRKSPAGANVRRKLPLPLEAGDEKDFVIIAPSPKKKRLLTEHQKEVKKAKKMESGVPALYSVVDQSQDSTQFTDWSQSLLTQSFNHLDAKTPNEKNTKPGSPKESSSEHQNDGGTTKLNSPFQSSIRILLDKSNDGLDPTGLSDGVSERPFLENGTLGENSVKAIVDTLPGAICSTDNIELKDEPIPSSQTTPSNSTKKGRRFYAHRNRRTLKNTKLAREKSTNESTEVDKMDMERENSVSAPLLTDLAENNSTHEETDQKVSDTAEVINPKKEGSPEPSPDAKKKKSSPISSRTRLKKKPTDTSDKTISSKILEYPPEKKQEINEQSESSTEEFSNHQLDDTEILPETNESSNNEVKETGTEVEIFSERPSSPVISCSAMKFVHSKNSTTGSPLHRPTRSLSSPACSPTTGILKRNRGKSETPSPPGKTRHVSFAFPLREEKEINFCPLDLVAKDEQAGNKKIKPKAEMENTFTSIKSTPTKPSTPSSKEDCVFPDLVECTTPVEQILPSLATSRWSRGLGHVVHAQNIRTVGNLSSLTKDQVEKLPIRSPKVATLRRVLKNFHETRPKSSKANQLRAIKEVSEETETEMVAEADVSVPEVADKETTSNKTEKLTGTNYTPDLKGYEPLAAVATPSTSSADSGKMLTPRRCRALVKPTTLFESDPEIEKDNENATMAAKELSENQDTGNFEESVATFTDKLNEFNAQEEKTKIPCDTTVNAVVTSSVVCENVDVVLESPLFIDQSTKMDVEEAGYEIPAEDTPGTEESTQENPETVAEQVSEVDELRQENQEKVVEVVSAIVELTQERQKMGTKDIREPEESKEENLEMPIEVEPGMEQCKQEMQVEDIAETEELEQENHEMAVEDSTSVENRVDLCLKTINDLLTCQSQQEFNELPLHLLLLCQERLATVLSNTTTAIKLKCELSQK